MKKIVCFLLATLLLCLAGCGGEPVKETAAPTTEAVTEAPTTEAPTEAETEAPTEAPVEPLLADGVYTVTVDTDSSMFHINEALEGKGTLTVVDGKMVVHMTLAAKGISKMFVGSAEDAAKEGAAVIDFTEDSVTYSDGFTDTAYGFDVPVDVLDAPIAVATFGKKSETWKDHTITVSNPVLVSE